MLNFKIFYLFFKVHYLLNKYGLKKTCEKIKGPITISKQSNSDFESIKNIVKSIEIIWEKHILKNKALCLHKSLIGYKLIRENGIDVKMCIGIRKESFEAHAWIEHNDQVVNDDHEYIKRTYNILHRI